MKAYIITIHRGYNYGSALQAFTLFYILKRMNIDIKIIDYIPQRMIFKKNIFNILKKLFLDFKNFKSNLRSLFILINNELLYNSFFRSHLNLTRKYYTLESLKEKLPHADLYITGSDQVWNSTYNQGIDRAYFLNFAPSNAKCISYAASFGKIELDQEEEKLTKEFLEKYSYISVRESSAKRIIEKKFCRDCEHVLDPTLLLSKNDWNKICPPIENKEPFLLIYSVEPNNQNLIKIAKKIAHKRKLKIYMVHWGAKRYDGVDKNLFNISPCKLISYFINADFIIASSFHGTAFSINLNKEFITVMPRKYSTRVNSLINSVGLSDRLVDEDFEDIDSLTQINYDEINIKLKHLREISFNYLNKAIYDKVSHM